MRIDTSLEGYKRGAHGFGGSDMQELKDPLNKVAAFLERYTSAKIIVIIDTHCLDGGFFAYKGSSPATYQGCSLEEVVISPFLLLFIT